MLPTKLGDNIVIITCTLSCTHVLVWSLAFKISQLNHKKLKKCGVVFHTILQEKEKEL
jgi:hypothetical protein